MVAILSQQRTAILEAVRSMYTALADAPDQGFHFPTGRAACEFVGYPPDVLDLLPSVAVESFAGVGYPFAVGAVAAGKTVLDVGSGSGTDVLIAARRIGPSGTIYGLDMTDAMLTKLENTIHLAGVRNVVPLAGNAEEIPLPDASVDVVTSNGVLNLVPDKPRCIGEIFRVLRPGGYAQIADIVLGHSVTEECRLDPELWAECVVGATLESKYLEFFRAAGFAADVLGRMDYFAGSPSPETRNIAASLNACSIVLRAAKPPRTGQHPIATPWPPTPANPAAGPEPIPHAVEVFDASGIDCGTLEPMLKTRMRGLQSGQVLEVRSDEPSARLGIPSWSRLTGHALVATRSGLEGTVHYFLRRR